MMQIGFLAGHCWRTGAGAASRPYPGAGIGSRPDREDNLVAVHSRSIGELSADLSWRPPAPEDQGLDIELTARVDSEVVAVADRAARSTLDPVGRGAHQHDQCGPPSIAFLRGLSSSYMPWLSQPAYQDAGRLEGQTAACPPSAPPPTTARDALRPTACTGKGLPSCRGTTAASDRPALNAERLAIGFLGAADERWWRTRDSTYGAPGEELAAQWPSTSFVAKKKFLDDNPNTVRRSLPPMSRPIRLALAARALVIATYRERF